MTTLSRVTMKGLGWHKRGRDDWYVQLSAWTRDHLRDLDNNYGYSTTPENFRRAATSAVLRFAKAPFARKFNVYYFNPDIARILADSGISPQDQAGAEAFVVVVQRAIEEYFARGTKPSLKEVMS